MEQLEEQYKSQQVARALEKKYGLNQLDVVRAERGFTPAEQAKAIRQGLPEVERHSLARKVRTCATASTDEAEFVRRARQEGLLVPRYAAGRIDVVTGYSVAERPRKGERAVWFGGNSRGRDLALRVRCVVQANRTYPRTTRRRRTGTGQVSPAPALPAAPGRCPAVGTRRHHDPAGRNVQ